MSHELHFPVEQERDKVRGRLLLIILVVGFLVMTLGIVVAALLQAAYGLPVVFGKPVQGMGPREIGGVDQTDIQVDRYGEREVRAQRRALERFRWRDRQEGLITIPIEDAMQLVTEGRR